MFLHTCPNVCLSVWCSTHIFFCLNFYASICCYIICIAMRPFTYLPHSYAQCLPYVSVSLSLSLSLSLSVFYVIMSTYHVYNCVRLSVTSMSGTCFHINSSYQLTKLCRHACQSACSSTCLSIRFYASGLTLRHLTESATLTLTLITSLILALTHVMRRLSQQP